MRLNAPAGQELPLSWKSWAIVKRIPARFLSYNWKLHPHPEKCIQANLNPSDEKEAHERRELRAFAGNINRNTRAVRSATVQDLPRRALVAEEEDMEDKATEGEEMHHRQLRAFAGNINRNTRAVRSATVQDLPRRALVAEEEEQEN